jgi:flavin reductase (DIM6/NTAB) family NADH-FMN oxidoreductase RutF
MADPTDSQHFRTVLGHFPTGVTVVTAANDGVPVGLTVGSFASVSLAPPLVAWMCGKDSDSWAGIAASGAFAVNVLCANQVDACMTMASKVEQKFEGIAWRPAQGTGSPIIEGSVAWIDCRIDAVHEGGDHYIVVGEVVDLDVDNPDFEPMIFYRGKFGRFSE